MDGKTLKDVVRRLTRLEKAVFGEVSKKDSKKKTKENYSGPTGGIKFLFSQNYFSKKHALAEVRKELEKNGYHYSVQAVQMALGRSSKTGGFLVALKEGGKKHYVKRK